jgi:peptidoglycan/LPS O-acetylase OafA/YrhL
MMQTAAVKAAHSDNAFDLIRFIAAFGVLYSHSFALTGLPEPTYIAGETLGTLSVFIFFAVSGYLVQKSWDRNKNPLTFAINRALRIYPGLVACLMFCAILLGSLLSSLPSTAYFPSADPYRFVVSHLAMFFPKTSSLPGVFNEVPLPNTVNGSLWTIRFEVFMYITLLTAVVAFRRSSRVIGAILLCYVCVWSAGKYMGLNDPGELLWRLSYIGLDGRILKLAPLFLMGALLARESKDFLRPWPALIGAVAAFLFSDSSVGIVVLWIVLPYCVLTAAYHAPKQLNRFGRYGDFSYGIYLYAFPVQQTLSYFGVRHWLLHLVSSALITIALAILSWKFIESPALKLKLKVRTRKALVPTSESATGII